MSRPLDEVSHEARTRFESIRQVNPYGEEYWSMRELAPLLGYDRWERVPDLIERARAACRNAGQVEEDHFRAGSKMIELGKGAQREIEEYFLSRFGCYLVAMNGDPRKPEIGAAQSYFALQTRRAERWDDLREELAERVHLRLELTEANKRLNATAQAAGVHSRSFGRLHDAGARGLYGGMSVQEVKAHKGIGAKEEFADRMGHAELAANYFVRTQTEEKIRNEEIQGQEAVIGAHHEVGAETRGLIERIGATKPEDLPAEPSIRPLIDGQTRRRKQHPLPSPGTPGLFDQLPETEQGTK
jgi:DNA-damage-inducible protein D